MSGKIVNCTNLDSVRIEVLGEGYAVTIPAALLLAADRVLRQCLLEGRVLTVAPLVDDLEGETILEWEAWLDNSSYVSAAGCAPWEAVMRLAAAIESERGEILMSEKCDRCGSVGEDRRTLWMACFYALEELGLPFQKQILFDAKIEDLEKAKDAITVPNMPICLQPGTVTCKGELTPEQLYTLRVCKRCRGEWMAAIQAWFRAEPEGEDRDADNYQTGSECGSGIYIRENGAIKEITREEWDRRNPGREPVVYNPLGTDEA